MVSILGASPKHGSHGLSALAVPDYVDAKAYTTHEEFTVPARAHFMLITVSVLSYLKRVEAAVPADVADGSASMMLNPGPGHFFACEPGEIYSLVSAGAVATIAYYGK